MKPQIDIYIGEFYATKDPSIIYTLLGSCIAVCLFDPVNKIGGMNHILLPGKADLKTFNNSSRYGINAMELLINSIMKLGGKRSNFIAKIFGGANLFQFNNKRSDIGKLNCEFILEFMEKEQIKINSYDLGGTLTRKIFFHTDSGLVLLKRLNNVPSKQLVNEEYNTLKNLEKKIKKPGKIHLFD